MIEPEAAELLGGAVTALAALGEEGFDVAGEVRGCGLLGLQGKGGEEKYGEDNGGESGPVHASMICPERGEWVGGGGFVCANSGWLNGGEAGFCVLRNAANSVFG